MASYKKGRQLFKFFLPLLVLSEMNVSFWQAVLRIRDVYPGSRNKPIPDPGSRGQKGPNPGSGSATLLARLLTRTGSVGTISA
jgi:hypothetical protein